VFETRDFEGCSQLEFTAQLEGGVGDCAWQHAQLFRQKITDDDYPLDITIKFKQQLWYLLSDCRRTSEVLKLNITLLHSVEL